MIDPMLANGKVRWTDGERQAVAEQYARLFGTRKATAGRLDEAQQVLTPERRKSGFGYNLTVAMRELIEEVIAKAATQPMVAPEEPIDAEENTERVHTGFYDRTLPTGDVAPGMPPGGNLPGINVLPQAGRTNGHSFPPPKIIPAHSLPIERTLLPVDDIEAIVTPLVEIQRQALALESLTAGQIRQAVRDPMNAGRIRNLILQASNALTFFEQLLRAAE